MSTMTTIILPAAAAASAANSNAAKKRECELQVQGYQHDTATVQEAQEYASCVRLLYPAPSTPLSGGEVLAIKLAILFVLVHGGWFVWKERENGGDVTTHFITFLFGCVLAIAYLALVAVLAAAGWFFIFG